MRERLLNTRHLSLISFCVSAGAGAAFRRRDCMSLSADQSPRTPPWHLELGNKNEKKKKKRKEGKSLNTCLLTDSLQADLVYLIGRSKLKLAPRPAERHMGGFQRWRF